MKLLPSFVLALLCFLLGISFTYWIQAQPTYEDVKGFFITGTSFALILGLTIQGVNLLIIRNKNRKDEKEKAIADLRRHTSDLIPVLRKWAEQPQCPPSDYLFPFVQQHASGDTQLQNILKEMNNIEGVNNTKSQWDDLQEEIPTYASNAIKKHACESFPELKPDVIHELVDNINLFLQKQYSKKKSYIFVAKSESSTPSDRYMLRSERSDGAVISEYMTANKKNIQALTATLNDLLVDAFLQEKTKLLMTLTDRLLELQNAFKRRINLIINEITYALPEQNKILCGKCRKCENIKNKWNID